MNLPWSEVWLKPASARNNHHPKIFIQNTLRAVASEADRANVTRLFGATSRRMDKTLINPSNNLRANILSGSAIMLVSSGFVGGLNLLYNLAIAHLLGAGAFGHASAVYTLLMLLSAVQLSFQILCSKFVARKDTLPEKIAVYRYLLKQAWICAIGVGIVLFLGRAVVSRYLNLPTEDYVGVLTLAIVFFIPLGVRRGLLQGLHDFRWLAASFMLEGIVKLIAALLFLRWGLGVPGVIAAIVASVVMAYLISKPHSKLMAEPRVPMLLPAVVGESLQASLFFAGQVIINNLDIVLVKHFFASTEAGVYAAVALVGRVVYMLSWSVVSAMFPFSAGLRSNEQDSRAVLGTALTLAALLSTLFTFAVWAAPAGLWRLLLGSGFPLNQAGSYRELLVLYAATTGIYALGVVLMSYEISRKIGNVGWVQLAFGGAVICGIYLRHRNLHDVVMVQTVLLTGLLLCEAVPFLRVEARRQRGIPLAAQLRGGLTRLRRVTADEAIAEFLKGEFYQPEFDTYREWFNDVVTRPDLTSQVDNRLRRALLYHRRGRLWREIPADTEWWEVELQNADLQRIRVFPRDQWRTHSDSNYFLLDTAKHIRADISQSSDPFLTKLRSLTEELAQARETTQHGTVLLIGLGDDGPLTIVEGNHRLTAAVLASPAEAHLRFRFLGGFSPHMMNCCWFNTDFSTLARYAKNSITWLFDDYQSVIDEALRDRAGHSAVSGWESTHSAPARNTGSSD
jgi:O-antigen/teichoic acid export membrane protein